VQNTQAQHPTILVSGSVAFDNIMVFPGYFKDHILPDKIHMLSVSFLVESMKRQYGGVASNIAYSLGLLGEQPELYATVGQDFDSYRQWLETVGVKTSLVREYKADFTATCYITTDMSDNQIVGFYPGAMGRSVDLSLADAGGADFVIVGPSTPEAIVKLTHECKAQGVKYIYAPTQQIVRLSGEEMQEGIAGAYAVVGNDYEFEMIRNKTSLEPQAIAEQGQYAFVTRGAEGSIIYVKGGQPINIPPAKPTEAVDPTGGGDAYLAGITKGLVSNYPLAVVGRLGSLSAVYAIEHHGTQAHHYTLAEFRARYAENFGELAVQL